MLKQGIVNALLAIALGLCIGAILAQNIGDAQMWDASVRMDQLRAELARKKEQAYVTTFEGLRVYAYECGTVVVE